jgi:hypothetical protein
LFYGFRNRNRYGFHRKDYRCRRREERILEALADKKALIVEIKASINLLDEKLLENDFM